MQVVNFASYSQSINVTVAGGAGSAWELEDDAELVSGPYAEAENSFDDPELVWSPKLTVWCLDRLPTCNIHCLFGKIGDLLHVGWTHSSLPESRCSRPSRQDFGLFVCICASLGVVVARGGGMTV